MKPAKRYPLLFGPYHTPRFRYGKIVFCETRGEVELVGLSNGRIPWPIGKRGRAKSLVVYGALARAVQRESSLAICYWWGVGTNTVWNWRRALGIRRVNEGSSHLWRQNADTPAVRAGRKKAWTKANDPERCRKIGEAHRGRRMPPHVRAAVRAARLGTKHSKEARRKMSLAQRRRGTWPPAAGRPWTAKEDAFVLTLPAIEAVTHLPNRTIGAVRCRREKLGLPDGRKRRQLRKRGRS